MSNQEGYLILELICALALISILIEVLSLESGLVHQCLAQLMRILAEGLK